MSYMSVIGVAFLMMSPSPVTEGVAHSTDGWSISASAGEWVLKTRDDHSTIQVGCTRGNDAAGFGGYVRAIVDSKSSPVDSLTLRLGGFPAVKLPMTRELGPTIPQYIWRAKNSAELKSIVSRLAVSGRDDSITVGDRIDKLMANTPSDTETTVIFKDLCFSNGRGQPNWR